MWVHENWNGYLLEYFQGSKPWRYTGKEENMQREDIKMLVQKWWDIYNDASLDYKQLGVGDVDMEPLGHLPKVVQRVLAAPSAA